MSKYTARIDKVSVGQMNNHQLHGTDAVPMPTSRGRGVRPHITTRGGVSDPETVYLKLKGNTYA